MGFAAYLMMRKRDDKDEPPTPGWGVVIACILLLIGSILTGHWQFIIVVGATLLLFVVCVLIIRLIGRTNKDRHVSQD